MDWSQFLLGVFNYSVPTAYMKKGTNVLIVLTLLLLLRWDKSKVRYRFGGIVG